MGLGCEFGSGALGAKLGGAGAFSGGLSLRPGALGAVQRLRRRNQARLRGGKRGPGGLQPLQRNMRGHRSRAILRQAAEPVLGAAMPGVRLGQERGCGLHGGGGLCGCGGGMCGKRFGAGQGGLRGLERSLGQGQRTARRICRDRLGNAQGFRHQPSLGGVGIGLSPLGIGVVPRGLRPPGGGLG